jgi:hypothetical protein
MINIACTVRYRPVLCLWSEGEHPAAIIFYPCVCGSTGEGIPKAREGRAEGTNLLGRQLKSFRLPVG